MGFFLITFDLRNTGNDAYERIYEWVHQHGGARYFQFEDGRWGRFPSTTVVMPLRATDNAAARDEFHAVLLAAGFEVTHVAAADGRGWAAYSYFVPTWEVPEYAKWRAMAGV